MSTAVVVFEHKFPASRGHRLIVPASISDPLEMLPAALPPMYLEAGGSGWIVVERQTGTYGPDARIISTVSPGLTVDTYA